MPVVKLFQTNFTGGEIDPSLHGRADLKSYQNGAERLRNVEIIPQGGVRRRPGTLYNAELANEFLDRYDSTGIVITTPNGGTGANANDTADATLVNTTSVGMGTLTTFVIVQYDLGASSPVYCADIRNLYTDSSVQCTEFVVQYAADSTGPWTNVLDGQIGSPGVNNVKVAYRRQLFSPFEGNVQTVGRYWRLARQGAAADLGTANAHLGGLWPWNFTT